MSVRTELRLRLPNSPGAFAGVCQLLAAERVSIAALSLEPGGTLRLLVDNHVRGAGVLRNARHQVSEHDVVVLSVPNAPGGLAPAAQLVASAGVNLECAYSGTTAGEGAIVVLEVMGDARRASAAAGV